MLKDVDLDHLRCLPALESDGSKSYKFETILNNNRTEEMRRPINERRTEATLRHHAAAGLGFEQYLIDNCPFFEAHGKIVEDARKLPFSERMRDLKYGDEFVQVKTIRKTYGQKVFFSEDTVASIKDCQKFNSFFVVGFTIPLDSSSGSTIFKYRPAFAVESKFLYRNIAGDGSIYLDRCSSHPEVFQSLCPELMEV